MIHDKTTLPEPGPDYVAPKLEDARGHVATARWHLERAHDALGNGVETDEERGDIKIALRKLERVERDLHTEIVEKLQDGDLIGEPHE